ncbi:TonB-dependent receptor [Nitratireductor aquibiodomus RA22]|uniref:TonB-dependent receptor n=1 Tax=Nitratireductor aquibiodomus RA22 TaxID=1189611 RepID=I5BVC3_9HYPH|nr:TonB-dependent receptor [Nitratireductor aquibiodomus]EIM73525.1 TonB-dependent receptor [Nitratireductor aquibiodomus RA22]
MAPSGGINRLAVLLAASIVLAPLPVAAQTQAAGNGRTTTLETITVTARRHAEDAQSVPISMNVIEGHETEQISPASSNADIARSTPNFVMQEYGGHYMNIGHIRGVGSLFPLSPDDTSVSFNVDEIPMSAFGLPPSTLDLSRVEVLRGPQGTLYGRNSQGGAVNFVPNRPEFQREFRLRGEIGSNGWQLGEFIANMPLIDEALAARLAVQYSNRDGDIRNVVQGGEDGRVTVGAARGSLLWTPSDVTSVLLSVNYDRNDDTTPLWVMRDAECYPCTGLNPRNDFQRRQYGTNLRVQHDFDAFRFTSISAFQSMESPQVMDLADGLVYGPSVDGPREDLTLVETGERNLFQEFRLSSHDDAQVRWTAGLNYLQSDFDMLRWAENLKTPRFFTYGGRLNTDMRTRSYAAFGEVSMPLGERLTGVVGIRVTHEEKRVAYLFNGTPPDTVDFFRQNETFEDTFLTGRVGLNYQWTDDLMTYASIGRGAVAGGYPWVPYNVPFGIAEAGFPTSVSWTYEAGFKAAFWDGRATLNGALFYNDVRDGHLLAYDPDLYSFTVAALDYETYGGELEARVQVSPDLTVFGGIGYTHATFGAIPEPSLTGARTGGRVPGIPNLTGTLGMEYRIDAGRLGIDQGEFYVNANYRYVGSRAVDVKRAFDLDDYGVVNARLGWQGDDAEIYLFANNLFDERFEIIGASYGPGLDLVRPGVGRTLGIGASVRF